MVRLGIAFEGVSPSQRTSLDRYLFGRMRLEARRRRHVRGPHLAGRRGAYRVEDGSKAEVVAAPSAIDDGPAGPGSGWTCTVLDLSASGCRLSGSEEPPCNLGDRVLLRFPLEGQDLLLLGVVVHLSRS
jgi:hypothetical protein